MLAMDKLDRVPTREPNAFEFGALPKLATKQDVIIEQQPDRIVMLGAIRAGKMCLQCHEGERGKLLGAFSYEIVPLSGADKSMLAIEKDITSRN
jgi:hypothetical protein